MADTRLLSIEAGHEILQLLKEIFQAQTGIDLVQKLQGFEQLKEHVKQIQQDLCQKHTVNIEIDIEKHPLNTFLKRDTVLSWMAIRKDIEYPLQIPPKQCPSCKYLLAGEWKCQSCKLELKSPWFWKHTAISSVENTTYLPRGFFLIPDPTDRRLLLLNSQRHDYLVWELAGKQLHLKEPWDVVLTSHLTLLTVDRQGSRIQEYNRFGGLLWEFDQSRTANHHLNLPIKATLFQDGEKERILIVDRGNHRVLAINRHHEIIWEYRELSDPTDAQMTYEGNLLITDSGQGHILELDPTLRVRRVYGENLHLPKPVFAQKLLNGHLLIVDFDDARLIECDIQENIIYECKYFNPEMELKYKLQEPVKMIRRENQNVLLMDQYRIMEISHQEKQLVWMAFLKDIRQVRVANEDVPETYRRERFSKSFERFAPPPPERPPFNLKETLQKMSVFQGSEPRFYDDLSNRLGKVDFLDGQYIMKKGEEGDCLYIISKGKAEVVDEESGTILATLTEGEILGEMAIIFREPRSASVRSLHLCETFCLKKFDFLQLLDIYPEIKKKVTELARKRQKVLILKKSQISQQAQEKLKKLMNKNKSHYILTHPDTRSIITTKTDWLLYYNELEHQLLEKALKSGQNCFEIHFTLLSDIRMKAARGALIAHVLDKLGAVIKTDPSPYYIMLENFQNRLAMTLITESSQEQVLHDASSIAEVETVDIRPIRF